MLNHVPTSFSNTRLEHETFATHNHLRHILKLTYNKCGRQPRCSTTYSEVLTLVNYITYTIEKWCETYGPQELLASIRSILIKIAKTRIRRRERITVFSHTVINRRCVLRHIGTVGVNVGCGDSACDEAVDDTGDGSVDQRNDCS